MVHPVSGEQMNRRKITDVDSLLDAIRASGLRLEYGHGRHLSVFHGKKVVATVTVAKRQDSRTYLNYIRTIRRHCGIDIREAP